MNMPLRSVSFSEEAFSWSKGKHLILRLLSSSARLDERNSALSWCLWSA